MDSEIERFAMDLERNENLYQELASFAGTSEELAGWLNDRGYRIDAGELSDVISASVRELSDDDLERVAGGTFRLVDQKTSMAVQRAAEMRANLLDTYQKMEKERSAAQEVIIRNLRP